MKTEKLNKLMNSLLALSAAAILVGAIFKIQHYPMGDVFFMGGILTNFLLSGIEISRLKKTIKKLKEQNLAE